MLYLFKNLKIVKLKGYRNLNLKESLNKEAENYGILKLDVIN